MITRTNVVGLGALGLATLSTFCGCSRSGPQPPDTTQLERVTAALVPLASCPDIDAYYRERALAAMNKALDEQKARYLQSSDRFCYADAAADGVGKGGASPGGSPTNGAPPSAPSETTGTNNQVANVDEADFVKNDGHYLYAVTNGALRIVEAWPAATMHEVSRTPIEGEPKKLFVLGDRALVFVSVPLTGDPSSQNASTMYSPRGYGSRQECTYGYDCDFTGDGQGTRMLVYDLADRAHPKLLRRVQSTSSLVAARRIGNAVHTVLSSSPPPAANWSMWPSGLSSCTKVDADTANKAFEDLRAQNRAAIEAYSASAFLPRITDSDEKAPPSDVCNGVYRSALGDGESFTTLLSFDLSVSQALAASTIISRPGAVYASESALYMSVRHERNSDGRWFSGQDQVPELSDVHKFAIGENPTDTRYVASGLVKGRALNQFALDEYEGKLRIATTTGHLPDPNAHNTLTVLAQDGNVLKTDGVLDHIAPTEDIRSARFDGPRGYIVTFKKTDPLFVLDLADSKAPKIRGELKIPGFSTYMHMMDEKHLLTIGYDADDHGSFAFFNGVLLQIFDVSDPANPVQAFKERIGTRGSSSEALTNHLAFTYFPQRHLLALPMTVCEGGGDGSYGTDMTFSGLMVYDVTTEAGFALRGRVAHPSSTTGTYDDAACSNWWTNASSEVRRSIFMDDFVYSISNSVVKAQNVKSMGTDLASVSLQ
jgi:hypothetical protein